MAGDWIKVRTGISETMPFDAFVCELGVTHEEGLFKLYQCASWFRKHSTYGLIKGHFPHLDRLTRLDGLQEAMLNNGFLIRVDSGYKLGTWTDVSSIRKSIGVKLRSKILSSGECVHCGSKSDLQVDHIIPVAKGGETVEKNLQPLCRLCNIKKGVN